MINENKYCPLHNIKCKDIERNQEEINKIKEVLIKREEWEDMKKEIRSKAPRWVLVLFITTSITIGGTIGASILWGVRESNKEIKSVNNSMIMMQANQRILLEAFDIKPIEKNKEVLENENINP